MAPRQSDNRKVQVNARVDAAALAKLDELATADRRSRSEMIDFAIQEYVQRRAQKDKSKGK